jgi:O-antigen/teichoic acid export membrane protein
MTTYLNPIDMGKYGLITSSTAFFSLFLIAPVSMFFNRRLHTWKNIGTLHVNFKAYIAYIFFSSIFALLTVLIVANYMQESKNFDVLLLALLIAASLFFNSLNWAIIPSLNILGRQKSFAIFTLATLSSCLLFSTLFTVFHKNSAEIWISGSLVGQGLFSFIAYRHLLKNEITEQSNKFALKAQILGFKSVFLFSWPIMLSSTLGWIHMQGYRFIIAEQIGLTELGIFVASYGVAAGITMAYEQLLATWFQPRFYRQANSENSNIKNSAWSNYASLMIPTSILSLTILISLASDFSYILLGSNYQQASKYVALGAVAEWVRVVIGVFSMFNHLELKTKNLILPNVFAAFTSTTLIIILLPLSDISVAPVAVATCGIIAALIMQYKNRSSIYNSRIEPIVLFGSIIMSSFLYLASIPLHTFTESIGAFSKIINLLIIGSIGLVILLWIFTRTKSLLQD